MRRAITAIIAVLLLYFVLLIARLPADWLYARLADRLPFELTAIRGSAWEGSARLSYRGLQLDTVHWQLAFWPLLLGRQELALQVDSPVLRLQASAQRHGQGLAVTARDLWLDISRLNGLGLWPTGIELGGELHAAQVQFALDADGVQQAQGQLLWAPAYLLAPQGYSHPGFVGELRVEDHALELLVNDRGGELAVEGLAWFAPRGDWRYRISVEPRAQATPAVERALQQLGRRDAQGRYDFAASGRL